MKNQLLIGLILILYLFSLISSMDSIEIRAAEPKRAIVSMEMVLSNDYVLPTINGETYYNKPPLFNWVQSFFFKIFNSFEEPVCRLPGIISLLITGFLLFLFGKSVFDKKTGLFAVLFFLTSSDLYFYGSVNAGSVDIFLSLLVFAQLGSLIYFLNKQKYLALFTVSWFFAALGFLAKGLPSLVVQAISLLILLILIPDKRKFFGLSHFAGLMAFIIPVSTYFYAFSIRDDIISLIINQFSESTSRYDTSYGSIDFLRQLIHMPQRLLVNLLMPWSFLLIILIKKDVRTRVWDSTNFRLLFWLTTGNSIIYFIAPDYHNRYLYPFLAFMSLLLSGIFVEGERLTGLKVVRGSVQGVLLLLSIATIVLAFLPNFRDVRWVVIKALLLSSGFIFLAFFHKKFIRQTVLILVFAMILSRFIINWIYLPGVSGEGLHKFEKTSMEILQKTNNQQVYLTGPTDKFPVSLELGPIKIRNTERIIEVPPMIPYQIPYYLTKETNTIMSYKNKAESGNYYISRVKDLPESGVKELMRFDDNFLGYRLVVFYMK